VTLPPDDPSPRSGSTTSLVMTIVGLYIRRLDGWIATSDLVTLAGELDVTPAMTRTAITRLKKRGILAAERRHGVAGYGLQPPAIPILERGDRRIFTVRTMHADDPWCLISFSVPETQRWLRGRLRRRLSWIGCGMVAPALWIGPDTLRDEVEEILADLEIRRFATLFTGSRPSVEGSLPDAVARWWDLERLAALHRGFMTRVSSFPQRPVEDDAEAFRRYLLGSDAWRVIPYLDPGLPRELLPDGWPGHDSFLRFQALSEALADRAWRHVNASVRVGQEPSTEQRASM
jgi:phenylacetic acid degradation operon negative regulatory protein